MKYLFLAFLLSAVANLLLIRLGGWRLICDTCEGVQKFHDRPVPRVGGMAIYGAVFVVALVFLLVKKPFARSLLLVLLCGLPVFAVGLLEDITKKVSPLWRLLAGFASAALAFFLISARISRIDLPLVDNLLTVSLFSFPFTVFAVGGVSQAFNIIDGFNGLSSGMAMMVFGGYAYVAFLVNDYFLLYLGLVMLFATLGFFIWNYPFGFIFLGDGGAYFLGYIAAILGVLLVAHHPQVSPWFPLLLVIYPIWEVIFSIYRRRFLKKIPPGLPDAMHFHSLIFRRLIKLTFGSEIEVLKRNAFTSPYLWIMQLMYVVPAVLFWRNTYLLMLFVFAFIVFYTWLYFRMVRFRTPRFFMFGKKVRSAGEKARGPEDF